MSRWTGDDDPDELLVDIMALETWRAQIDKRSGETAKKRKAAPVVGATATVPEAYAPMTVV